MGVEIARQLRSDAVYGADRRSLTCADACEQALRTPARLVRDEESAGSGPFGLLLGGGAGAVEGAGGGADVHVEGDADAGVPGEA